MASMMSSVKFTGWLVRKRTRGMPIPPTMRRSSAKEGKPGWSLP